MTGSGRIPLLVLLFVVVVWMSRLFSPQGETPAFSVYEPPVFQVSVVRGDNVTGVYQKIDELPQHVVNSLTNGDTSSNKNEYFQALNGFQLAFDNTGKLKSRSWMPASQRIALQIPLHPDRMSQADWMALPGIGPALSAAIEASRQKNGEFGVVDNLTRVSGIGPKRLSALKEFFYKP